MTASDSGAGARSPGVPCAIVTDIEGTTSSIAFVKEVLFPFAREHLPAFVNKHAGEPEVARILDETRALVSQAAPAQSAPGVAKEGSAAVEAVRPGGGRLSTEEVIEVLLRWIDEDRKATPLKTLQGLLWADGFANGTLKGHVYEDAVKGLRDWHAAGHAMFVFSSGSVAAQRLLFGHTTYGDLTPLFQGYFDTTTGPKMAASSYLAIASAIGRPPGEVLFLSDHTGELDAAVAAGMRVICLDRGEAVIPEGTPHRRVRSFAEIEP